MRKEGIRVFYTAILSLLMLFPLFSLAYTSPGKPTGLVNDFAGIISPETKLNIENKISSYESSTGNQIVIVTIRSLGDETIDSYAVKLFEDWGIGQKGKDNGVLLLVSLDDRKMRIEVGYGLEPFLTDAQATTIKTKILTPAFQKGDYSLGIDKATDAMISVLGGNTEVLNNQNNSSNGESRMGTWIYIGIFIFLWLVSILGRSKSWWLGGVLGAIAGIIITIFFVTIVTGVFLTIILTLFGLLFDFVVSKTYVSSISRGGRPPWWIGGGFGGGGFGGHGGFGGFGGGMSGGGGSSGGW